MPSSHKQARSRCVVLLIRDGWGHREEKKGNAIAQANTPHTDRLMRRYFATLISASGETVGLPKGDMVTLRSTPTLSPPQPPPPLLHHMPPPVPCSSMVAMRRVSRVTARSVI